VKSIEGRAGAGCLAALTGGNLRAAERTYQLLHQVGGRAERKGRVLIQTFMPDQPVMKALASGDRDRFLEAEAAARRQAGLPPFGRLAALIVSASDAESTDFTARALARAAPQLPGVTVLGPAPRRSRCCAAATAGAFWLRRRARCGSRQYCAIGSLACAPPARPASSFL